MESHSAESVPIAFYVDAQVQDEIEANSSGYAMANVVTTSGNHKSDIVASSHQLIPKDLPSTEPISTLQHVSTSTEIFSNILLVGKKKVMPPVSIMEMNRMLVRNHVSSNSMVTFNSDFKFPAQHDSIFIGDHFTMYLTSFILEIKTDFTM